MKFRRTTKKGDNASFYMVANFIITCVFCFFVLACHDDNRHPIELPEAIVAPTAGFNTSTEFGKAPLVVDFSDVSNNGTSNITSWQWDFGDGNSSSEQNPQHTYHQAGIYDVSLIVSSADGQGSLTRTALIQVEAADVMVKLAVVDEKGLVLSDIAVEASSFEIESSSSDENGLTLMVRPTQTEGVIKLTKNGYLPQFVHLIGVNAPIVRPITMLERNSPIPINGMTGGIVAATDGILVDVPAESLVDSRGNIELNEISVFVTPVDISDPIKVNAFPGSFYGAYSEDAPIEEQDQLFSYGVVDITFENENGELLQLREGMESNLTLPLYSNKNLSEGEIQEGDTMPIWYLDENTGIWVFEDDGIVVTNPLSPTGLSLQGTTTHFTSFNSDINPAGLGRGAGGNGSGNGASNGTRLCQLNVDLLGAIIGETYDYRITYWAPGWPPSSRNRQWNFDGSSLTHRVIDGYVISVSVTAPNGDFASDRFGCGGNDEVSIVLAFEESPPEFRYLQPSSQPVFTKNNSGEHEVTANKLFVGADFIGTDVVTITSELLDQPMILGRGIYREVEYTQQDPNPVSFTGKLINDQGEVEETISVDFIDSLAPVGGLTAAYYSSELFATIIEWGRWQGADRYWVYHLGDDPDSIGLIIAQGNATDDGLVQINEELKGYIRIEFENQYGVSHDTLRISETPCPIGSELCSPSQ